MMFGRSKYLALFLFRLIVLVLGMSGNILVVFAVYKKRSLRTTTNLLLLNLAISDLTTLVFSTLMLIPEMTTFEKGRFSDFLCIFFLSRNVPLTTSFVSILTLTVLAIERYHAVVQPMMTRIRLREDTVKYACLGVWLAGICLALPFFIFSRYDDDSKSCLNGWKHKRVFESENYHVLLALVVVFLPFLIISFCYWQILRELYFKNKVAPQNIAEQEEAREKRKIFRLSVTITGVFVLFLFPYAINTGIDFDQAASTYRRVAEIAFFSQSAVNPVVYSFQSSNFRQAFKEILLCRV